MRNWSYSRRGTARVVSLVGTLIITAALPCLGQDTSAQLILYNGKVVTVDQKFTIAQAVAVRADRISAVGSNDAINRLADPNTRRINLGGHTVLPGFIDNHMHLLRFGTSWKYEVRLDDIESRKAALAKLSARANLKRLVSYESFRPLPHGRGSVIKCDAPNLPGFPVRARDGGAAEHRATTRAVLSQAS